MLSGMMTLGFSYEVSKFSHNRWEPVNSSRAFNGRFREECLNESWFLSLEDAREKVAEWRQHYNRERPHGSLGNLPPVEFAGVQGAK